MFVILCSCASWYVFFKVHHHHIYITINNPRNYDLLIQEVKLSVLVVNGIVTIVRMSLNNPGATCTMSPA